MWTGLNNGHCAAWSWSKKARAGWSFHFSINGNGALSKFPAEIITQGETQDEVTPLWLSRDVVLAYMVNGKMLYPRTAYQVLKTEKTQHILSCYHHNCLVLSLWTNQSTELKILHKGEPSALSSHILCRRPPAWREVRLLLILPRSAGGKEVQSWGGGGVQMKAGNTLQTGHILCVRST